MSEKMPDHIRTALEAGLVDPPNVVAAAVRNAAEFFEIKEDESLNYNVYDIRLDRWGATFRMFQDAVDFATVKVAERRALLGLGPCSGCVGSRGRRA